MKIWKQIKYPLLILLVVLVLAFSRYVALAIPSWSLDYTFFYDPLLVVRVISLGLFNSHILLDILLLFVGFFTILALPVEGKARKWRKYLLRPALSMAVMLAVSSAAIDANNIWEDWLYKKQMDETYANIHAFVEDTDVAYAYNTSTHNMGTRFREEFPQLLLTHRYTDGVDTKTGYHYCDYLLVDYDTQRIAFIYTQHGILKLFEYQLSPADTYPTTGRQKTLQLDAPGQTLMSYRPGPTLLQYTDGFTLTMADGSIYTITGLCEKDNLFLDIQYGDFQKIEDFPE